MRTRLGVVLCGLVAALLPAVAVHATSAAEALAAPTPECTVTGTPGPDVLVGTSGRDVLCGRGGDDRLLGRGGDDELRGGAGDDELSGGAGDDVVGGARGKDAITGGVGDDRLRGGKGSDRIDGRDAAAFVDRVRCGPGGADRAFADMGDDVAPSCEATQQNDPPVAVADARTTPEDAALVLPTSGPVGPAGNDVDADGDALTVTAVAGAVGGTATISAGSIRFTPTADLCGVAAGRFDYTVSDAQGGSDEGRVTVDITCAPDSPTAADDTFTTTEDSAAGALAVLANDSDVDGDPLVIGSVTQAANGTVAITGGGSGLTYEPDPDYCNDPGAAPDDTFTYTLTPGADSATVAVTVTCVDDPPTAADDIATVGEDSGATAIGVLANDTDADAGPMTIDEVTQPDNGTVVVTGGGTGLTYEPDPNFCSATPDTFDYTLAPGGSPATVSITVTCVDDPPTAVDDTKTVVQESGATTIDVLANDVDDGGPMTIDSVSQPADGTVVITGGGAALTYQPDAGFCGPTPDTFTYTLNGGDSATVRVTVACFAPAISTGLSTDIPSPALNQLFNYIAGVSNTGNVPLDGVTMTFNAPVELSVVQVTTGTYTGFAELAPGEGARVLYEKNTALGVFTLWGSSPNTTTNTTLTAPPPGLGAGEYITRVRWLYGQAAPGASAATTPTIRGRVVNPDNQGGPVAAGDSIQAQVQVSGTYTAGPTNVGASSSYNFNLSAGPASNAD